VADIPTTGILAQGFNGSRTRVNMGSTLELAPGMAFNSSPAGN
jgi:hypothetical protein